MPPKFISDEDMAALDAAEKKKPKKFISDEEMAGISNADDSSNWEKFSNLGFFEKLGIPSRAALATIRSGQEAIGGDPSKPWENVLEPGRDLGLDAIRAITSPSGKPDENQGNAMTVEKIGSFLLGAGVDPLNYIPVGAIARGIKGAGVGGANIAEKGLANVLGFLGEKSTIGAMSRKGSVKALEHFSPVEQIFSKNTLRKALEEYGPANQVMGDARHFAAYDKLVADVDKFAGTEYAGKANKALKNFVTKYGKPRNVTPDVVGAAGNLTDEIDSLGAARDYLKQRIFDLNESGEAVNKFQNIAKRLDKIEKTGEASAPEIAGIIDHINKLEFTPMENERAIFKDLRDPLVKIREQAGNILKDIAPDYKEARDTVSAAKGMALGRAGGRMTDMIRSADFNAAVREALSSIETGKSWLPESAAKVLAKSGPAWNALIGTLRIPADITAKGAEATAQFIMNNPETAKALQVGINQLLEGNIQRQMPPIDINYDEKAAMDPGNDSMPALPPPAAPQMPQQPQPVVPHPQQPQPVVPMPPPIDPKDQALMDLTGLQSVMGGKIQDPMERTKFIDQVEENPHLSHRQKMIIQIKARRDGTIILPQDLR